MKNLNCLKRGNYGLASAIEYFASQGHTVCVPLTDTQKFDLVVEMENSLCRIQVKTTTVKTTQGSWVVELKRTSIRRSGPSVRTRFDPSVVDFLFVLAADGKRWLIPAAKLRGNCSVWLGTHYEEFRLPKMVN